MAYPGNRSATIIRRPDRPGDRRLQVQGDPCPAIMPFPTPADAPTMNDTEFNTAVDAILITIEDAIETMDTDIDAENAGGILTLTFENDSKVIINRQGATQEIWVAARSGGFHCGHRDGEWICNTTKETLATLLTRVCTEQAGMPVTIAL